MDENDFVSFGHRVLEIPKTENRTIFERDGQYILIGHNEALHPLLGDELLDAIKAWTRK
jgi:hypothetical protein